MEDILNTAAPLIPTLLKMEFEGGGVVLKFHLKNSIFAIMVSQSMISIPHHSMSLASR